jgi:hypothetical protein
MFLLFDGSLHPNLDLAQQLIQIIGIPFILSGLIWGVRAWVLGQRQLQDIDTNSKNAFDTAATIKRQVDTLQTNHLLHLQEGITLMASKQDRGNESLISIDASLKVMVDRGDRSITELTKMREDFHEHSLDDKFIQVKIVERLDEIKKAVV